MLMYNKLWILEGRDKKNEKNKRVSFHKYRVILVDYPTFN